MGSPSVTPFLILLALLVPAATAGMAKMPQDKGAALRQMLRYLSKTVPPTTEAQEWSWTIRPRTPADLRKPMPKKKSELNHLCWTYFGHPQTIRDVNSFFKWGCQPYPNTCNGIKALPKECIANMFYVNEKVRAAQVKALYGRCNMKVRPIDKKTGRYVSYCEDIISGLRMKIQRMAASKRKAGRGRRRIGM